MNKKTDNMDMDNAYMRAEQKRQETERHATRLKEFLIYGADIPEDIQKQYLEAVEQIKAGTFFD